MRINFITSKEAREITNNILKPTQDYLNEVEGIIKSFAQFGFQEAYISNTLLPKGRENVVFARALELMESNGFKIRSAVKDKSGPEYGYFIQW